MLEVREFNLRCKNLLIKQVEAVYKRFEVLTEIKNNNWKKPEALPPPSSSRTNKKSIVSSEEGTGGGEAENFAQPQLPRRPKPAVKAQASGGLKAFLAKRNLNILNALHIVIHFKPQRKI